MVTLICFALKEEAAPFHQVAASRPGVFTILVGMGRRNAETSARRFLDSCAANLVLTCGFAGGLNPELKPGDVVFEAPAADATAGVAPNLDDESAARLALCQEKLAAAGARPGRFFCADIIATTAAEKTRMRAETDADAVEMESAAIHAVCRERGIPCVTVRAISDAAGDDLPLDFNALTTPDHRLDMTKLAWAIARSPGAIAGLLELREKTRLAAEALASVLGKAISR
jgi:adenosylhomocysteine nucleosidase